MTSRLLLAWMAAATMLSCVIPLRAQNEAAPAVDETKASAVLAGDTIRVQLPLLGVAGAGNRAFAWILSPDGERSGEASVDLAEKARMANFSLNWPRDAKGKRVDEIGWYRLGYRVEAEGAAHADGVLSLGAIAGNLLALRLALPARLSAGRPLSVRVFAGNPVTRAAFRRIHLRGTLKYDGEADEDAKPFPRTVLREATTGSSGEAVLVYPVEGAPGDTATLTVTGSMDDGNGAQITASITADVEINDRKSVSIETDKPLHKPGETVHLRALVFDDGGRAAANAAITLKISDPDNKTLLEAPLTTNRFGITSYDWKTKAQLSPGAYQASFELDDSGSSTGGASTTLAIRRYELPEFAVSAATDRGFYLSGDTPVVHIHAGYLLGKPVTAGGVRVVRAERAWYGSKGKKESEAVEQRATLNEHGDAELSLDLASEFAEFKGNDWERFRDVEYRAYVTDPTTGRAEPRSFTVRLTRYPVHIYLYQLGGNHREGDFLLNTSYADGTPAVCKVALDWMDANSNPSRAAAETTNRYGQAKVHLRYQADALGGDQREPQRKLRLTARDAQGRTSVFDDTIYQENEEGVWFSVAESLLAPNQSINATLHAPEGAAMEVDVYSTQGLLAHQRVRMTHPVEALTFPANKDFHGVVTLIAYTINIDGQGIDGHGIDVPGYGRGWHRPLSYKSVLYPEDRELRLKLTGLRSSYAPGAQVAAGLDVRDAEGNPVGGALGLSVIDSAVEQRAETEEDAGVWWGRAWWQSHSNGSSSLDLNKVDMSQPVPDDMQLAAEGELTSSGVPEITLSFDDYDDVRQRYTSLMHEALKPLGDAVLDARTTTLPATLEAVREIARRVGLDDAMLMDPWKTHYRMRDEVDWNTESIQMLSAGPDKRFGTDDDFTIDLVRRNVFAVPGERLTKLLRATVDADRPLPATIDDLKRAAGSIGLDLDSAVDPEAKPYVFQIDVGRRFYFVRMFGHDAPAQPDGRLGGGYVWTSPAIDYFAQTEKRMEAALVQWTNAGRTFPVTESEAHEAFAAAGIDFSSLRDPLGQTFQLRTTEVATFAGIQSVVAGTELRTNLQQVTRRLRAIQILNSQEVVAQFLTPVTDQSGRDLNPKPVEGGVFKANTGAIGGVISDASGAVIPGATVTVKRNSGETIAAVKSGEEGAYLVNDLEGGLYTVEVAKPGFVNYVVSEARVSAASLTRVDITLAVGSVNSVVDVQAQLDTVETSSATVGSTVGLAGTSRGRNGKATITESTYTPRLRHSFEETAVWAPSLETNAGGRAGLRFHLPDSLTTWKLHTTVSTVDGRVGTLDQTFKTFQPLFVDLDLPQMLTVGDEISLPVNLRNYTGHSLTLPVTAKPTDWLTLLTPGTVNASLPAEGATTAVFGLRAAHAVDAGPLRVTAANAREGDAVERTVDVHPDGEPLTVTAAGMLTEHATTLTLDLPADAIPGSIHAEMLLYPNLGAHVVHAIKAALERPHGCAEQTISSTYPSLLYLELVRAAGAPTTAPVAEEAQTYLQLGYERLLDYFDAAGGVTYWGGKDPDSDPALTAYAIEFLSEAVPYLSVDRTYITKAAEWLISHQQPEGGWRPRFGENRAELNLYIATILQQSVSHLAGADATDLRGRTNHAVARAVAWSATSVAAVHSPYANAFRMRLAMLTNDAAQFARLRDELAATAVRDTHGLHWSPVDVSPFYGWGRAGELETTALVLAALPKRDALSNDALFHLLSSQDRYGAWFSGQATVRVLQALLPTAIEQMSATAQASDFHLLLNGVPLTGDEAQVTRSNPQLLEAPLSFDLTRLKPGHNELTFVHTNDSTVASAEASASFYIPWQGDARSKTQTGDKAGLDFDYRCAADSASVGSPIACSVAARRFGSPGFGMLLAEVGLPPGAEVDRASLAELQDHWTISRYELQPDRIVFYVWPRGAEKSEFTFRFTPRFAMHAKAAPATLSDYYNPDLRVVLPPQTFLVLTNASSVVRVERSTVQNHKAAAIGPRPTTPPMRRRCCE